MAQTNYRDTHVPNRFVAENAFLKAEAQQAALPVLADVKESLPTPWWKGHESVVACYWKAWELAFLHLRQPLPGSHFVANFIDPAFNECTYLWDSCFMTMFGRYGHRAFNFQRTLDNFYARQHRDGFICRQLFVATGEDAFERFDASGTGPNILPWAEWEYYGNFGDRARLAAVFPVLLAYTQWFSRYRTWPDGTYWSSGWGCGMDNQPRLPPGCSVAHENGHMSWIDTTLQQVFACRLLGQMADVLDRPHDADDLRAEGLALGQFVNAHLWHEEQAFYVDRFRDGSLSGVKSVAGYWALLAEAVPQERLERFVAHLSDPRGFGREHRVPSLSADDSDYKSAGDYWRGSVWSPTNYMVLRGLTNCGRDALAHEIALGHVNHVTTVFEQTHTLWENYAPDAAKQGSRAKPDFVGWTGLSPIAILLEYCLGLRADVPRNVLLWDVRLLEEHGVEHYPFGLDGLLNLRCHARTSPGEPPVIEAHSNRPLTLTVRWDGGTKNMVLG